MTTVALLIIAVFVAIFGSLGTIAWLGSRKRLREAKNYERGLKMVPMLIHLPPQSSDIDAGSRDARDVAEEGISQAQVLYDIIASTAQKGFKSKFYGQRHITLEIIATRGRVNFYTAVPVALVSVVQQAIISAYPTARLEEVEEHNIFSPVGKLSGTIGGELILKDDYIKPIATYQETKRDTMSALLNSLSELGDEDGAGIQILLRPAKDDWAKRALQTAKDLKDGKDKKGGLAVLNGIGSALWKPPDGKDGSDIKQLTNLQQGEIDAIENKTKHAAYETLVRVVASSNTIQRSQSVLNNMVATFALFDAPGKNGFKYSEAKDIDSFVTAYILRFFPPEVNSNILNSVELATLFHFPDDSQTPTSQLERQMSKQVDGPRGMPTEGMLLGYNVFRGVKKEIRLTDNDRRRHLYIVGQTGTGKSTALENLALQDMLDGKGFAFVDPHGDTAETLLGMVPKERIDDVIYFCPADMDYPMGLNLFEFDKDTPEQKDFLIQEAINMLYKLYDPQRQGIIGPRYEHWFRNAALTLMADPAGSTFIDIPKVFTDNEYAKQKLKHVQDQTVLDFWNKEMAQTSDYHKSEVLGWFVSKFGAFLSNEMMRNIIGQTKSSFDLREIMDEGKILLVNLSKGRTGELNSKLLGMIFVMKFQSAAMSRANVPEDQRRDFSLYVDEFQNFSTDSFSSILSEARKYRLNLIVANQFISQLTDDIRDAVFGNVGSVISFRTGASDADFLVKQFSPTFDVDDLVRLPNFNAVSRVMANNVPSQPFSIAMLPPLGHDNQKLANALKRMSHIKYGKPKSVVEEAIFKRLETLEPPKPKFGAGGPGAPGGARAPGSAKRPVNSAANPGGKPSFLDDWLEKRKQRVGQAGPGNKPSKGLNQRTDNLFGDSNQPAPPAGSPTPASPPPQPQQQPAIPPATAPAGTAAGSPMHKDPDPNVASAKTTPPAKPPTAKDGTKKMDQDDVHTIEKSPNADKKKSEPNTTISGATSDEEELKKMSQAIKAKSNLTSASVPEADPKAAMLEDDDMYIDKDGNIHYKEE